MTEEAKRARREYKRKWNQENKDKVKKHTEAYWERQAQQAEAQKPAEPAE